MRYLCRGKRGKGTKRQGCGQDMTKLVNRVPEDGKVHEVKCPTCYTVATVRRTPKD